MSIQALRKFVLLAAALAALALAGCGGDDEDKGSVTTMPYEEVVPTTSETETTEVDPETETLPNDGDGTGVDTGESGQGGAGDEVPAQTLALFTGEDGDIEPRVVRVPAFISVRVELRSADGARYTLVFGDKRLEAGGQLSSVATRFDGLRPGEKLVGTGTGGRVTVEATAEPGP